MLRTLRRIPFRAAVSALLFAGCAATVEESPPPPMTLSAEERMTPATLLPGDAAPPLEGTTGFEAGFETGRVTLLCFWATWSEPCAPTLAHLRWLEERFEPIAPGRLDVIALTAVDVDNDRPAIDRVLREHADRLPARVLFDADGAATEAYRRAAREELLPCAFIVDGEGRLAWIGTPIQSAGPLEELFAGRWDPAAARRDRETLLGHRRSARKALGQLAMGDRSALELLAHLPPETIPFEPPWIFRVDYVTTLARGESPELALRAAAEAVADPGLASDPRFLAHLARAVRVASPEEADEYAAVSLATLEAHDRAARRRTEDPIIEWIREREARTRGETFEVLAEDAFDAERPELGADLYRRAIEATDPDAQAEERARRERRSAELNPPRPAA